MKKQALLLVLVVLCLGSLASADSFYLYSSRVGSTDFIDWTQLGPDYTVSGATIPTPAFVGTAAGNFALVGNTNGGDFLRSDSGISFSGNFGNGENLVWTGNPLLGLGGGGPLAIELFYPVGAVMFGIQADESGPFTASVDIFDSNFTYLTSFSFNGNSGCCFGGNELVIGIQDTTAVNIGAVVIGTNSGDPNWNNDFLINDPSFNYTTPEPSSLILVGSGAVGLAGVIRRKLGR
ncbi:MAG TPA: PEP-CTERM sorting domain-containing protein [Candidatus Angelobacter sp.]|nr:PEP-CTERM sorting domain-containing protein [Candidatus Angelobacter sp.]